MELTEKIKTCGECEFVKLHKTPFFTTTYCGLTGDKKTGVIVPHEYNSGNKTITYTRIPEFCKNENVHISNKPAPKKFWKTIKLK